MADVHTGHSLGTTGGAKLKGIKGVIVSSELLPQQSSFWSEAAHREYEDWNFLRGLGYTVWNTNRPKCTEL